MLKTFLAWLCAGLFVFARASMADGLSPPGIPGYITVPALNTVQSLSLGTTNGFTTGGYYASGDGGGGVTFKNIHTTSCTPNGGTVVKDKAGRCYAAAGPVYNVLQWGAVRATATPHPISAIYPTLAAAQVACPQAVSLSDEVDWYAACAIINAYETGGPSTNYGGPTLYFPGTTNAYYRMSEPLTVNDMSVGIRGDNELSTKLVWTNGTECIDFGLANVNGNGGALAVEGLSLMTAGGDLTHTCINSSFGNSVKPTINLRHVQFNAGLGTGFGTWRTDLLMGGGELATIEDVTVTGAYTTGAYPCFSIRDTVGSSAAYNLSFIHVFMQKCYQGMLFTLSNGLGNIQGVHIDNYHCNNCGDAVDLVNSSGTEQPLWVVSNSGGAVCGWFVNTAGSTNPPGVMVISNNFIQIAQSGSCPGLPGGRHPRAAVFRASTIPGHSSTAISCKS